MKRMLLPLCALLGFAGELPATAQDATSVAARQETEDRFRRLQAELEDLKSSNLLLQRKVTALDGQVQSLIELTRRVASSSESIHGRTATRDEVQQLAEKLRESERKREEDKQLFKDSFAEIKRLLTATPVPPAVPPRPKSEPPAGSAPVNPKAKGIADSGVYHTVERNQTLLEIIKAYNDDQKGKGKTGRITLTQVMNANPGLEDKKMKTGQKIFIPLPDK